MSIQNYLIDLSRFTPLKLENSIERPKKDIDTIKHIYRNPFQRDRDRILYSRSFKRLYNKTQIFLAGNKDYTRTRLTHSLEVAQIAKTITRALNLDEDLTEAIALGHDIGHAPFGHAGELILHKIMTREIRLPYTFNVERFINEFKQFQGFKHNWQSIIIPTLLEWEMNLTNYTLYGMLHHTSINKNKNNFTEKKLDFYYNLEIQRDKNNKIKLVDFLSGKHSLEAAIVAIADEIAQRNHDIQDGIEYNLIEQNDFYLLKDFSDKKINDIEGKYFKMFEEYQCYFSDYFKSIRNSLLKLRENRALYQKIYSKIYINLFTTDLIFNIIKNIKKYKNYQRITDFNENEIKEIVRHSDILYEDVKQFNNFLFENIHNSKKVREMNKKGENTIIELFRLYLKYPQKLPDNVIKHFYFDFVLGVDYPKLYNIKELRHDFNTVYNKAIEAQNSQETLDILGIKNITVEQFISYYYRTICNHIASMTDNYCINDLHRVSDTY